MYSQSVDKYFINVIVWKKKKISEEESTPTVWNVLPKIERLVFYERFLKLRENVALFYLFLNYYRFFTLS